MVRVKVSPEIIEVTSAVKVTVVCVNIGWVQVLVVNAVAQ